MVEGCNLTRRYGSLTVLDNVDITIGKGDITSIVGASGAGKTTLLQILGTLDRADAGRVIYDGIDVTRLNDKELSAFRNRNIGFVFQFNALLPEFNVVENVAMPALIGGLSRREAESEARHLIDYMGLSDRVDHRPNQLSGGECQRVAVARVLVNRPAIVFADEPTGALDSANREQLQRLFRQLRDDMGQTFVIVTHDMSLAQSSDRIITLADGRIISDTK